MDAEKVKTLIQRVVNVFETGRPEGVYEKLVVQNDGREGSSQISYGRSMTTEQGNLRLLVEMYVESNGKYAADFIPYLELIDETPLTNDQKFKTLLVDAAKNDQIMRETQDDFFDKFYWAPAYAWFTTNGFTLPLSLLVIYDSFIHSGSILWFLRKRFTENIPIHGGAERKWIEAYVQTRHQWLKYHKHPILRLTTYRTQMFLEQIEKGNWDFTQLPLMANGTPVHP